MEKRIPIIFDTDIGVDDAYALLLAAGTPSIDILGITTVFGNTSVENATRNALQICELLGLDVPVAKGAAKAFVHPLTDYSVRRFFNVHGDDGLGDVSHLLPDPVKKTEEMSAVQLMAKLVSEHDGKVVLVPVGPLTNIATFLMTYPELKEKIDGIAIMGGAVFGGNATITAEANIVNDPEAAQVVFQSGLKIVMCGLDATNKAYLSVDDIEMFRILGGKVGEFYYELIKVYAAFHQKVKGSPEPSMHDSVPVAWLIDPEILTLEPANVKVDLNGENTYGCTASDLRLRDCRPNAMVAMDIDRERFVQLHMDAFRYFGGKN